MLFWTLLWGRLGTRSSLNQLTFSKSRWCSIMWVGLVQSGEDLNRTKTSLPQWEGILWADGLHAWTVTAALLRVSSLLAPPCAPARLRNCMSHFLKINHLPTYPFFYLPTYLQLPTYLSTYLPTSNYPPTYLSTYLPPSTYLPTYPSTYLPTYPSISLSTDPTGSCFSGELWLIHMVVQCMFSFVTKCLTSLQ